MRTHPKVSFVIIGRNEEENLADCIRSIVQVKYPPEKKEIIYVDNSSTDRSVEIARRFPIKVVALQRQPPTPGLARNAGLQAAAGEYVQFVDGDMAVECEWLSLALPSFDDPRVAAVTGRLKEVHPQKSLYNKIFDLGWKLAEIGEIGSPGGGGLFRASVLREAGGYDDSLFGAEEIDLGYRLRHRYFKIIRLPHLMARHDMGMKSFGQFWRRSVRDGYWEMAMILRYFNWSWPPPQDYIWKMNLQLIAFFTLLAMLVCRPHPILGALALGLPAIFLLKKTRHFYRVTGERKMSWLAALFNYLNMFPLAWGQMRFLRERASSRCKNILQKPAWRILRASNRVC